MNLRPWTWWVVFAVILAAGIGAGLLMALQGFTTAGRAVNVAAALLAGAWVLLGLYRFRESPRVRQTGALIAGTAAATVLVTIFLSFDSRGGAIAVAGIYAMSLTFFGGLMLIRLLLAPGFAVLGVARTLVDEAIRMKVPLIFIIALVLLVPIIPYVLDPKELLRYRLQSFLTYAMIAVSFLLSLMTVFLAVGTISNEVSNRQIYLTMTKPVSRAGYLLGKWVGIMALNAVLVAVCGGGVYVFTMLLAQQPAITAADARAVEQQVLTARRSVTPVPGDAVDLQAMFRERLTRLRISDPTTYGQPGDSISTLDPALRRQIQQQVITDWYVVPPRGSQTFQFTGLKQVAAEAGTVQLRLTPRLASPSPDGLVRLVLRINGRFDPAGVRELAEGQAHVLDLPAALIDPQGKLTIEIHNVVVPDPSVPGGIREQPSITFNAADGIELLYSVGAFGPNLARGMVILWVRLGFLAMLGLAAGSYLSFPIACLLAFLIYFAAAGSGYLAKSMEFYAAFPSEELPWFEKLVWVPSTIVGTAAQGEVWEAIKVVIRLVGSGFMLLVPSFGEYNPTPLIADGRWVAPRMVGGALLWVGLVWTGVTALVAWLIFRRRELARVQV